MAVGVLLRPFAVRVPSFRSVFVAVVAFAGTAAAAPVAAGGVAAVDGSGAVAISDVRSWWGVLDSHSVGASD